MGTETMMGGGGVVQGGGGGGGGGQVLEEAAENFGAAIGSRIDEVEGVSYGAFIVPGLIMLSVLVQSVSNASFGIYFPKFIGTIYELLSAPASFLEITAGYVLAAATKSLMIGVIILMQFALAFGAWEANPVAKTLREQVVPTNRHNTEALGLILADQ